MIRYLSWLALAILAAVPPSLLPNFSTCGFRFLTGLLCPFCGMTHGLIYWMHGEWKEALHWHALTPVPIAILLVMPFRNKVFIQSQQFASAIAALFAVFGVLRWCAL